MYARYRTTASEVLQCLEPISLDPGTDEQLNVIPRLEHPHLLGILLVLAASASSQHQLPDLASAIRYVSSAVASGTTLLVALLL